MFVVFQLEDEAAPSYRIENLSESVTLRFCQQGTGTGADGLTETLGPGECSTYSWLDPERGKAKRLLCCHLDLPDPPTGGLKTEERLEVDLDNAEYSRQFRGVIHVVANSAQRSAEARHPQASHKLPGQRRVRRHSQVRKERALLQLQVVAEGCTKALRLTETRRALAEISAQQPGTSVEDESRTLLGHAGGSPERLQEEQPGGQITGEPGRQRSCLESLEDYEVLYEVERKNRDKDRTFQLDICAVYASFVAHSEKGVRKEFILACLEKVEFLAVSSSLARDYQLRIAHLQVDNNIHTEGRHHFPHVLYPKELSGRAVESASAQHQHRALQRKGFFNAQVRMRQSEHDDTAVIHKVEFLLQSAVLQMDDELIVWIVRFVECVGANSGSHLSSVHPVFKKGSGVARGSGELLSRGTTPHGSRSVYETSHQEASLSLVSKNEASAALLAS